MSLRTEAILLGKWVVNPEGGIILQAPFSSPRAEQWEGRGEWSVEEPAAPASSWEPERSLSRIVGKCRGHQRIGLSRVVTVIRVCQGSFGTEPPGASLVEAVECGGQV